MISSRQILLAATPALVICCAHAQIGSTTSPAEVKAKQETANYFQFQYGRKMTMDCVFDAAVKYQIPANILLGLYQAEGGSVGRVSRNTNQSIDMGPMQINSVHLKRWKPYGITEYHIKNDGCYNLDLAAYHVRELLDEPGSASFWQRIGNYHSRTPSRNIPYRERVMRYSMQWAKRIDALGIKTSTVTSSTLINNATRSR